MFRRCAINRWTCKRPSPLLLWHPELQRRAITTKSTTKPSASPPPSKPRAWRQLVALAIIGVPGSFIAYYFLDQDVFSIDSFAKYTFTSKDPVSSSAAIFLIEPANTLQESARYKEIWRQGIWNVQFKQPQLQILRAYTPLPPIPLNESGHDATSALRFLIRNDPYGEVSGYLHRLPVGSTIEIRGPSVEHVIGKNVKEVIFLAGGTGIAPALQVAHAMFDGLDSAETQDKKLHILWASRKREDCAGSNTLPGRSATSTEPFSWKRWFNSGSESKNSQSAHAEQTASAAKNHNSVMSNAIVHHLFALQARYPGQISVSYFVDEDNTRVDSKAIVNVFSKLTAPPESSRGRQEIIISGPPGFIAYLAGPKVWQNGIEEQGPLRGIVGSELAKRTELSNVKVWKV